ncbi:Arm DNA-binding domain-containing protein, partial [Paraperlucidibaca baekdonensis]|uniref:Arm DNA-binding domain-containing protein n=1 Tax=Paraperlucidibaca baekdonensis TaxID=748120 RepID=UPI000E256AF7
MAHVSYRVRKETGKFVFDVRIGGCRVRPQTNLKATKANERLVEGLAKKMNAEIEVGTFGGCPRLCVTGLPSDTVASDRRHHEQGQTPHQR